LFWIGVVCDVHKISHFGSVDLFILCRYQHSSHANKLEVCSFDLDFFKVAIDQAYRKKKSLSFQFEFQMDLYDPVYKNSPHLLVYVVLSLHVLSRRQVFLFTLQQKLADRFSVFGNTLRVTDVTAINWSCAFFCYTFCSHLVKSLETFSNRLRLDHFCVDAFRGSVDHV
jgi:hypothetical protein